MSATVVLIGLGIFLGSFLLMLLLFPSRSPESSLLEEVTQKPRMPEEASAPAPQSGLDVERLAKPFAFLTSFFTGEPNPDLVRRLLLAGYRKRAHADIFLGSRILLPLVAGLGVAFLVKQNVLLFFLLALVVGFFVPDLWLAHAIKTRRENIRLSIPDALDLLAICIEAGLSLDQAILRVGQELHVSHPELSDELLQINFEQRAGVPRLDAWRAFSGRVDLESVRSFVAMLVQTDRFGTPISKSLGNFSDALRTQRRQQAEEMAAKTTIKLVPPLVFFIFPNVFIVTVVPAVIIIMKSFTKLGGA